MGSHCADYGGRDVDVWKKEREGPGDSGQIPSAEEVPLTNMFMGQERVFYFKGPRYRNLSQCRYELQPMQNTSTIGAAERN